MAVPLLERDTPLQQLAHALTALAADTGAPGRCVLLPGEPGIGKTRLLQAARQAGLAQADWWWGACEPLLATLPLAPLIDMLGQMPPHLADAVRRGGGSELLAGLLAHAQRAPRPLVLVVDDVQWADGATLDLLRFLARRIASTRLLMVLAWRDTEVNESHPLHTVLAGLQTTAALRLTLAPLSAAAVATLAAQAGRPADGLHAATGGNPFFVTELLSAPPATDGPLPATVRDAILARATRLSPAARELLDWVSISPPGLERDLLQLLCEPEPAVLDEALASALLLQQGEQLRFVHELGRRAVESALGPRAASLHTALFDVLGLRDAPLARQAHHAAQAGLEPAVRQLAPQAATQAAQGGAHRQAALLLALALEVTREPAQRLALLEAQAEALLLTNQLAAARQAATEAMALTLQRARPEAEAAQACRLARIAWLDGRIADGQAHAAHAVALLQDRPGPGLARALLAGAQLRLRSDGLAAVQVDAQQALALFQAAADQAGTAQALAMLGAARLGGSAHGQALQQLADALQAALATQQVELAGRVYTNLAAAAVVDLRLADLDALGPVALRYCDAHDLEVYRVHLQLRLAYGDTIAGRWGNADLRLQALAARPDLAPLQRQLLRHLLALQAARRAEPGAARGWEAISTEPWQADTPWFMAADLHRIELAALAGRTQEALALAELALQHSPRRAERWCLAQLQLWRRRLGVQAPLRADAPVPVALEAGGDHAGAARAWAALGAPYLQALALLHGDEPAVRDALTLFNGLGALLGAQAARRTLRRLGAIGVARGPYRHVRADPLGLTAREREVLDGLIRGLSNREIAQVLHRSERTVENHVASLLGKLGARDRHDAVRLSDRKPGTDHANSA